MPGDVLMWIQAASAAVTALATVVLWNATRILARETRILSRMSASPFVVAHIEVSEASPHALQLMIENTGNGTAFDVRCIITPKILLPNKARDDKTSDADSYIVNIVPPGKKISVATLVSSENREEIYSIKLQWKEMPGHKDCHELAYKTSIQDAYQRRWGKRGLSEISKSLDQISRSLAKGRP